MTVTKADEAFALELFSALGEPSVRRMFGGAGVYVDGLMCAILDDGLVFLKVDDQTRPEFEAAGLQPFTYEIKDGETAVMSYYALDETAYDDPEVFQRWAGLAVDAARRAAAKKAKR